MSAYRAAWNAAVLGFTFGVWQWDAAAGCWMLVASLLLMQAVWGRRDTEGR